MPKSGWIQQNLFETKEVIPMRKKSKLISKPTVRRAYDAEGNLRVVNCECDAEFSIEGSRDYPVKGKYSEKCPGCNLYPWFKKPKLHSGNGNDWYPISRIEDGVEQI
jgi:hypothetical protein